MSIGTFQDARAGNNPRLIRKALAGLIYVKRWEDGDPDITTIWTSAAGLVIPAGFVNVGLLSKSSAVKLDNDTENSDVESWGYVEPTRRDITKDVSTVQFTMQQTHRIALELYNNVDLSGVTADGDGNIVVDKASTPEGFDWRMFVIWKDGAGADEFFAMDYFPNARVTGKEGLEYGSANVVGRTVTMTGFQDPDLMTAHRQIMGGPGVDATEMGFTA